MVGPSPEEEKRRRLIESTEPVRGCAPESEQVVNRHVLVFDGRASANLVRQEVTRRSASEIAIGNEYSLVSPGTELALYNGTHIGFSDPEISWAHYPLEIGYASAGIVVESERDDLPVGTRVVHYGAHSDRTVIDPDRDPCAAVPDQLDLREACFGRFAQIAYSAVHAAVRSCDEVLVFGAGIVGNLCAQWFGTRGSVPWIADLSRPRLDLATRCGLDRTINAPSSELASIGTRVQPDTIVEATGVAAVIGDALVLLRPEGQLILLGSIRTPVTINAYKLVHRKGCAIIGAHETVLGTTLRAVLERSLHMIAERTLVVAPMISCEITPDQLPGVYDTIGADPDTWFGVLVTWR